MDALFDDQTLLYLYSLISTPLEYQAFRREVEIQKLLTQQAIEKGKRENSG